MEANELIAAGDDGFQREYKFEEVDDGSDGNEDGNVEIEEGSEANEILAEIEAKSDAE